MPVLVHITDEKTSAGILRAGIRPGKQNGVVYFMPVGLNHLISHQWIRELRRGGSRVMVGVYFRLSADEIVWAGRYNEPHQKVRLGNAIQTLNGLADPLGFELFMDRKIEPSEIQRIRHIPQGTGWRYQPHAHGRPPCGCPACLPKGSIKSRRIRNKFDPIPKPLPYAEIRSKLETTGDTDEIIEALWLLRYKRRMADPAFLERLLTTDNDEILEELAVTLQYFKHPDSKRMLAELLRHSSHNVTQAAMESLSAFSDQKKIA